MGCGSSKNVGVETGHTPKKQQNEGLEVQRGTTDHTINSDIPKFTGSTDDGDPQVTPPRKKRSEAVPPNETFDAIDKYALSAPRTVTSSVKALAQYLMKESKTDMEKVRVFFRWMTQNISYDAQGFKQSNYGSQDAESVLTRGYSVCSGYSSLFKALCDEAAVPCKKISGFAKGFSYNPTIQYTENSETNHAWNLVFIGGNWWPIDVTWASGHVTKQYVFEREFKNYNFLMDPEDFIIKHFPFMNDVADNKLYQLLNKPLTLEQFNNSLAPSSKGIEMGFVSPTHKHQVIEVNKSCEITVTTTKTTLLGISHKLVEINTGKDYSQYALLRRKADGVFTVTVTPPHNAKYDLDIFGETSNSDTSHMITYLLQCKNVDASTRPFPKKHGIWGLKQNALGFGFTKEGLKKDVFSTSTGEIEFDLPIQQFSRVLLTLAHADEDIHEIKRYIFRSWRECAVVISARLPMQGFYKVTLFAKDPTKEEATKYEYIGDVLVENKCSQMKRVDPFPLSYTEAELDCTLQEPLSGNLPANREMRYNMTSSVVKRVMINSKTHISENGIFDFQFKTSKKGDKISVFGSPSDSGSLTALYQFQIV